MEVFLICQPSWEIPGLWQRAQRAPTAGPPQSKQSVCHPLDKPKNKISAGPSPRGAARDGSSLTETTTFLPRSLLPSNQEQEPRSEGRVAMQGQLRFPPTSWFIHQPAGRRTGGHQLCFPSLRAARQPGDKAEEAREGMCPAPPWQYITLQTNCSLEEGSCGATRAPKRLEPSTALTHFTTSGRHPLHHAPVGGTQHPPPHGMARRSQLLRPTSREASNHDRVPGIPAPAPAAGGLQRSAELTTPPRKASR